MNPLKAMMGNSPAQMNSNPMDMIMQIMMSPNKEQAAMQMLAKVNPQAYQMIQSGASPEQVMNQFGITPEQIQQVKSQFGNK